MHTRVGVGCFYTQRGVREEGGTLRTRCDESGKGRRGREDWSEVMGGGIKAGGVLLTYSCTHVTTRRRNSSANRVRA